MVLFGYRDSGLVFRSFIVFRYQLKWSRILPIRSRVPVYELLSASRLDRRFAAITAPF